MPLYDRLLGIGDADKIPVHQFQATLAEFGRGRLTGQQAQTIINAISGSPLLADEVTDAQAPLTTITSASGAMAKLARVAEIDHVLMLAEALAPGYNTPALIKARLGV